MSNDRRGLCNRTTPHTAPVLTEVEIVQLIDSTEWSESWKGARIEFARAIEAEFLQRAGGGV